MHLLTVDIHELLALFVSEQKDDNNDNNNNNNNIYIRLYIFFNRSLSQTILENFCTSQSSYR